MLGHRISGRLTLCVILMAVMVVAILLTTPTRTVGVRVCLRTIARVELMRCGA